MTYVAPIAPTPWTGSAPLTSLDSESLIIYCQSQLDEVDLQVAAYTHEQEFAVLRKKAVQSAQAAFEAVATGQANAEKLRETLTAAIRSLPKDDPTHLALDAEYDAIPADGPTKEYCDAAVERLRGLSDEVSGDAEINMIRLQSLVSARQTMVGLVTNILSKIQAGEKAIVDNIR